MIKVGLTGGIGSGKTTVAGFFSDLGIPVYNSDQAARRLMESDTELMRNIRELLGDEAYTKNDLNTSFVAQKVFNDKALLQELNLLVHPKVADDFKQWAHHQKAPYVIQEAAVLFENGAYRNFDKMILVKAPVRARLKRVMERDQVSEAEVKARMDHQWEDARKEELSDFVIENRDLQKTAQKVLEIHRELAKISGSPSH